MKIKVAVLIVFSLLFAALCGTASGYEKENKALSAAQGWLALVDEGEYRQSWEEAAGYFKAEVKPGQWEQAMQSVRKPLGKLVSRTVTHTSYQTSLPGAPHGEYVVIQFSTSYENKTSAVETVTPMKDTDGKWRVSGYYIK